MNDWGSSTVRIGYANMAQMNKIRAWARKNNATVKVSRYARDAYEGEVIVHSSPTEGIAVTGTRAQELRELMKREKVQS